MNGTIPIFHKVQRSSFIMLHSAAWLLIHTDADRMKRAKVKEEGEAKGASVHVSRELLLTEACTTEDRASEYPNSEVITRSRTDSNASDACTSTAPASMLLLRCMFCAIKMGPDKKPYDRFQEDIVPLW